LLTYLALDESEEIAYPYGNSIDDLNKLKFEFNQDDFLNIFSHIESLGYSLRNSSALFCFNYGSGKFYLKVII
jgi:hypothetical protein